METSDDTNDQALLLFQLGPVQKFIAQAETVGDLKAGSEILSELTAAALKAVPGYAEKAVFPAVGADSDLRGIPNRFLVYVPRNQAEAIAKEAAQKAQETLEDMAAKALPKLGLPDGKETAYNMQVEQFLQTTWAILKEPSGKMGDDYKTIGKLMAMRRNTRTFNAWHEEGNGEIKDYLSGKEAALDIKNDLSNRNSGRGAMNLIKKSRTEIEFNKKAKEALGKYLAVIALDGDHMGEKLSGFKTSDEHLAFSRRLAAFANGLKKKEQELIPADGFLIYAGGDDVLAVVKATDAVAVAEKLSMAFYRHMNGEEHQDGILKDEERKARHLITASVGIAIGSTKVPLQDLVHAAHEAESRAKHVYGRDALALDIYKRSGEILKWGCKFGSRAFEIYGKLTEQGGRLSRFAYKLASFLEPYDVKEAGFDGTMQHVFVEETLHTIEQTEGAKEALPREPLDAFLKEPSVQKHPEDYLGLFLCEAFINRPR